VTYDAELRSETPLVTDVKITNNAGIEDIIKVENLKLGDVVKVYKYETTTTAVLGTATVSSGKTDVTIKIPQLGLDTGSVYLSVTTKPLVESDRIEIAYDAEEQSTPLSVSNIIVTNNTTGTKDTLKISNVVAGDIIKVYRDSSTTTKLATLTITDGITKGTVNIDQLGISSGSIYITITKEGQLESDRIQVTYNAEH
jgi:DNA-directed RNA polymerase subunit H (RpoH/RPB5)